MLGKYKNLDKSFLSKGYIGIYIYTKLSLAVGDLCPSDDFRYENFLLLIKGENCNTIHS